LRKNFLDVGEGWNVGRKVFLGGRKDVKRGVVTVRLIGRLANRLITVVKVDGDGVEVGRCQTGFESGGATRLSPSVKVIGHVGTRRFLLSIEM
jgi:hypothetical protein